MSNSSRHQATLTRTLAELQKALLIRTTLLGIEKKRYVGKIFTRIVHEALENDYTAHAIKVFERSTKSAGFWYLYRTDTRIIDAVAKRVVYKLSDLEAISDKLKIIRNGTHFHIDAQSVLSPKEVWKSAGLTGNELARAIDFAWEALGELQLASGGTVPSLLDYEVSDAHAAICRVEDSSTQ